MSDYYTPSRRDVLKGAAATGGVLAGGVLGGVGGALTYVHRQNAEPVEVEIYQTERQYDAARERLDAPLYGAEVVSRYVDTALNDLFERGGTGTPVTVTVEDDPVDAPEIETMADLSAWWQRKTEEWGNTPHAALLIDAPSYIDALGHGERGITLPVLGVRSCGTSHESSEAALVGNGRELLGADPRVQERIMFHDGEEHYTPPERTALGAIHEVGHTLCLDHGDGAVRETPTGRVITPMQMGYASEIGDGKDVYVSPTYSDAAVEEVASRYD